MTFVQRALLYLARKRGKTLALLLILFAIAVLALSSVAVRNAAQTVQLNVRQALGGEFTLGQDTENPDNWEQEIVEGMGTRSNYTGEPITAELGEEIEGAVAGIKGHSARLDNVFVPEAEDGAPLELAESGDGNAALSAALGGSDFSRTVQTIAVTDSRWEGFFANGYLKLIEGEHVTVDSGNKVLVSKRFAEANGLEVGDAISLRRSEEHARLSGYTVESTRTPVEIAGIFEETVKSSATMPNWSLSNAVYTTKDVMDHARPGHEAEGYDSMSFYVDDPGELAGIVEQVEALDAVARAGFKITVDASDLDAIAKPLENMDRLMAALSVAAVAVGAVVLYLVLSSRVRDRLHDSGVLLSLGLKRSAIVGQYLTEVLVVAAIAFALAVPASAGVAQAVGDGLLDYASAEASSADDGSNGARDLGDGMAVVTSGIYEPRFEKSAGITEIDVAIDGASAALLFGVGFAAAAGAVLLASIPLRRMSPREIMSTLG